ncbi:hypothetical protein GLW04_14740 [Halobacillus litoralis]|uniref:Uncharacterized protein n=2 Tax=Halobacillus litoralis TaxID=45668 RepID=A0A845DVL3_9BACI|nr:hypothetical protein [Halobacillus litoralis]
MLNMLPLFSRGPRPSLSPMLQGFFIGQAQPLTFIWDVNQCLKMKGEIDDEP